jgi:hypothetical protein
MIRSGSPRFTIASSGTTGEFTIRLTASAPGKHTYALRSENLRVTAPSRRVTSRPGRPATIEWKVRRLNANAPWTAVVVEDGDARRRRELFGQ